MTNHTTSLNTSEPKYRKKLNKEQIAVLHLLYKFRFASSEQIAAYQEKPSSKSIQKRLKILEDQGFIAKRYDKSYKLKGKPAAYYLLPKGAREVPARTDRAEDEPINVKSIYKDKDVSESFIQHCLNILDIYLTLRTPQSSTLSFYTKSDLKYEHYEYFPQPLPDLYIRLKTEEGEKEFFLDVFENNQPFFVLIRRIKRYLEYAGSGEWPNEILPIILLVVESPSVHRRLRKRILRELQESYEDIVFATTSLNSLFNPDRKDEEWFLVDGDPSTVNEPQRTFGLARL
ncbi:MAG TPA: replication-relaxation family protein [Candidatus Saccharimonadales bacterium]|nr:replication-relaxation family protein [Candidatus Saccharimonadales bacterium]